MPALGEQVGLSNLSQLLVIIIIIIIIIDHFYRIIFPAVEQTRSTSHGFCVGYFSVDDEVMLNVLGCQMTY